MLNSPDRPDKLDGFSSASVATGIKADTIAAIRGQDVADDTLPSTEGLPTKPSQRDALVGTWRSHLNFAREVVNTGLSSALIMSEDSDWDASLKSQLQLFAQGSQYVTSGGGDDSEVPKRRARAGSTHHQQQSWSPYGDNWDLLWLGHCGSAIKANDDARRFIVENDATVPAPRRRVNQPLPDRVDMAAHGYDNSTRVFFRTSGSRCTYAYALSARGARRVLATLAAVRRVEGVDLALSRLCAEEERFVCVGVFPQLVGEFQRLVPDDQEKEAEGGGKAVTGNELALLGWGTPNIVHSTRLNMVRLLAGNKANFERQWPDDPEVRGPAQTRTLNRGRA